MFSANVTTMRSILPIWRSFSIITITLVTAVVADGSDNRYVFLNKLANCKGFEKAPLDWRDVILERDRTTKDFTFSVKLKVLKEVSTKLGMEFTVWKCDQGGSLDSCEYFLKEYRNDEICTYLVMKNQFWSSFIDHFEPNLVCPLKPGTYMAYKIPFKSDFLELMPIQEAVWKARLKGFDNDQTISCVDVELKVGLERRV